MSCAHVQVCWIVVTVCCAWASVAELVGSSSVAGTSLELMPVRL